LEIDGDVLDDNGHIVSDVSHQSLHEPRGL
jgi:hypothetical protein